MTKRICKENKLKEFHYKFLHRIIVTKKELHRFGIKDDGDCLYCGNEDSIEHTFIGPIYTRDGSSVWDELGQRTVVRLIIRLCINTGFQTDHPSRRTITVVRLDRRTTVDNSSGRMIRLSV